MSSVYIMFSTILIKIVRCPICSSAVRQSNQCIDVDSTHSHNTGFQGSTLANAISALG